MADITEFNIMELIQGVAKINTKFTNNYLNNISGYHHDIRDITLTFSDLYTKVFINPAEIIKIYGFYLDFLNKQQQLWNTIFINDQPSTLVVSSPKGDKRFQSDEWIKNPGFNFVKQNYLLAEKFIRQIVTEVEMDEKIRRKLDFYVGQYVDAFSPANFLFTNPEVLKLAAESNGETLWKGFNNLVKDIERGRITQTDESAFTVGENIAVTAGTVVYENELIQLIQYTPLTTNVHEIPLLIIPPWINKYYILDLQQKNSFVKFLTEQNINVFIISWRNPHPGIGRISFDNYTEKGALKAIEVVKSITKVQKINTMGYCLGGTLLSIACSILAQNKNNPVNSTTFLASMVDFSYIGPMGDVIDWALIRKLERGELLHDDVLHGHDMERAFNLIRANDLIWNYAVSNYLKGMSPSAFDVLYWTNDNTNLPASMYLYYMKHIILENRLSRKNSLTICDTPIDIGRIDFPVYVIGLKEDYISPAKTCFTTTKLVSGPVEFILGGSGHVMGVVNPPSKRKYGYYTDGKLGKEFSEWLNTAHFYEGSWWTPWSEKLKKISGKQIPASAKPGNATYKAIEPAPGKYVKEKCKC